MQKLEVFYQLQGMHLSKAIQPVGVAALMNALTIIYYQRSAKR
jgi:hypothetical protein